MKRYGSRRSVIVGISLLVGLTACKDGTSTTDPPGSNGNPSISVSVSAQSVTIAQGGSGSVGVTVARAGGFAGEIAVTLEGLPAGVTGDASPGTVPANATAATLSLSVGAAVDAGSYTLTVRASGAGVTAQTATFTLNVTAVAQSAYTLTVNPTSVSMQQGGNAAVTVTITRANFAETVALSLSGAPPGLVTSFNPAAVSGNSSALSLTASASATPGTYALTITGTANGLADRTASIQVTITAAPPSENVTWSFCAASGVPTWVAYRDGTNAWTQAMPTGNTYSFDMVSGSGGIATVTATVTAIGTNVDVQIYYGTTAELTAIGNGQCTGSGTLESYTGSVAGFAASDQAWIAIGGATALVLPPVNPNFALTDVPDGANDQIAALITLAVSGGVPTWSLSRLIMRRNEDPAAGAVLPTFDFATTESFAPVVRSVSLTNLGTDVALTLMGYHTATGTTANFFTDILPSTATSRQYPGIPTAQQATGDLHTLMVLATPPGQQTPTEARTAGIIFREAVDKAVPLGPSLGTVTVSAANTSPYVMPRTQVAIQPEYNRYFVSAFSQTAGGMDRSVTIATTAAYLGTTTDYDVSMPDFSAVPGWNGSWGFLSSTAIPWSFNAFGWDAVGGSIRSPFVEGASTRSAMRSGELRS